MSLPPHILEGMRQTGGRYYAGPGLGVPPPWECTTCGTTHYTPVADGCAICIAASAPARAAAAPAAPAPAAVTVPPAVPQAASLPGTLPRSPLLTSLTSSLDHTALLAAIDQRIRAALIDVMEAVQHPAPADGLTYTPPELYALALGLQLVLVAQDAQATVDPFLPVREDVLALLERLQAHPDLQAYVAPPLDAAADGTAPTDSTTFKG